MWLIIFDSFLDGESFGLVRLGNEQTAQKFDKHLKRTAYFQAIFAVIENDKMDISFSF
ncbi:MAG: hypothetical protein Fur0043_13450 [Anaerolineales bacterium]